MKIYETCIKYQNQQNAPINNAINQVIVVILSVRLQAFQVKCWTESAIVVSFFACSFYGNS